MAAQSSWSLRGVDPRVRDIARSAAKREGVTIGEWLSRQLLDDGGEDDPLAGAIDYGDPESLARALGKLSRKIEAAEHRSALAISDIDHSVHGVISRLQDAEDVHDELAGRYSAALEEMRETQKALHARIERLERDGKDAAGIAALKSLEEALSKVADQVYAGEAETRARLDALKADVEAEAKRADDRIEGVSRTLDERIAEAARKAEADVSAVSETVAQVGDATRQLGREIEAKSARLEEGVRAARDEAARARGEIEALVAERAAADGADVERLETAVAGVTDRLSEAERVTDAAIKALERTFAELETRVGRAEAEIERGDSFAATIESRFEGLSRELADAVAATRAEIARKLAEVAEGGGAGGLVEDQLEAIALQVSASEAKQRQALARISAKVAELSDAVEAHAREARRWIDDAPETVSAAPAHAEQAAEIAQLEARLTYAEETSSAALDAVSRRLDAIDLHLSERDDDLGKDLDNRIRASEKRTRELVEVALANASRSRGAGEAGAEGASSPVQRALDALRIRLEALETSRKAPPPAAQDADAEAHDDAPLEAPPEPSEPPEPPEPPEPRRVPEPADELGAMRALRAKDAPAAEAPETRKRDDALERNYGRVLRDGDHASGSDRAPLLAPFERSARHLALPVESLRAARDAIRRATLVMLGESEGAAGFDPAGAVKGRRSRNLLFAAGGLAFLAVGAAGVIVLRDSGRSSRDGEDASDPLGDLFSPAPMAPLPAPDAARAAPDARVQAGEPRLERSIAADLTETPKSAATTSPVTRASATAPPRTIEEAVARGDPVAQYQLGSAHAQNGDWAVGASLLRAAAEAGLAPAQYRLGKLYESGRGVEVDPVEARRWTERAASAGHRAAMHALGVSYAEGRGVPQDFETAVRWFKEAAQLGSRDSQYNLGELYARGLGAPQSLADAYVWFSVAARAGDRDAAVRAAALADDLAPRERAGADEAARRFTPRPLDEAANGVFPDAPWDDGGPAVRAAVARAQAALAALGYAPGPADGVMGERTEAAISAYQSASGLAQTGQVDAALLEKLEADAAAL